MSRGIIQTDNGRMITQPSMMSHIAPGVWVGFTFAEAQDLLTGLSNMVFTDASTDRDKEVVNFFMIALGNEHTRSQEEYRNTISPNYEMVPVRYSLPSTLDDDLLVRSPSEPDIEVAWGAGFDA